MSTVAARALEQSGVFVLTTAAPVVPVDRFAAVFAAGGLSLWDPTGLDEDGWSFVGGGETFRVEASGPNRFEQLRTSAEQFFAQAIEDRAPDAARAPPLRLFGGLSFEASDPTGLWAPFGQASFIVPRWLYGRRGNEAFIRIAIGPEERSTRDALRQEISALINIAESGPTAPSASGVGRGSLDELSLEAWSRRLSSALDGIRSGSFLKVVAARRSTLTTERSIDVSTLLARMGARYPDSARFAIARAGSVFVGATPERLVSRHGSHVHCDALAGSRARRDDDANGAEALLASEKDQREHAPVVAGIRATLKPYCRTITSAPAPQVRTLRTVHHLWTPISAELAGPTHALDLVAALHPTPAVSGLPRKAALDWISANEPEGRGWYAAPVGWFDAEGNGTFMVAIRSALVRDREAWLYAGGGIVEGSDPAAEYQETALKQQTMLAAFGSAP